MRAAAALVARRAVRTWVVLVVASLCDAAEQEAPGALALSEPVPERQKTLCRDVCKLKLCEAASADDWLDGMVKLRGASALHRHLLAAWSVTVWKPELLLPRILEKWDEGVFGSANIVHGSMWQAMRFLTEKGKLDAQRLFDTMFGDYLGGWDLELSPPPPYLETWVHGFGHGALYAAHKSQTDNASLSCAQGAFDTSLKVARLAEDVCEKMPGRPLQYFCASGIYHSVHTTALETSEKKEGDDMLSLAAFGNSALFDICEKVHFPSICMYQRLIDVLDEAQVKNLVIQLATEQAKAPAEDDETPVLTPLTNSNKDAPPLRDIVAPFCPPQRWGEDLLGCHFAVSAAFAKTGLWTTKGFCEMPTSYEVCRPSVDHYDDSVATLVRACVAGLFSRPSIFSSDRFKRCPRHELAFNCRQSCDLLKHDPNPNLQAAYHHCRSEFVCLDTDDPPPAHMDVLFNVSLLEPNGHHHPASSTTRGDLFHFNDEKKSTATAVHHFDQQKSTATAQQ